MKKYKLGEYIERSTANNHSLKYKEDLIVGVTSEGVFSLPKGNVQGVDLKPYKIVNNGDFVYNPSRFDLGSIAYRTEGLCIVSHLYQIFHLNEKGKEMIDPIWLFIYLRRNEFRREVTFRNFGSQRPEFNFNDLSDIELPLPSIEQQRKYVDVYLALQNNLAAYQSKAEELKLVCDGYIEELRRRASNKSIPMVRIGDYISKRVEKNSDGAITLEQGINIQKQFITPQRSNSDLYSRRIVRKGDFAYCTQLNNENVAIAYREDEDCVVSSVYDIFYIKDESVLFPLYLMLWFRRSEFGRYVYRLSTGTSYEFLSYEDLSDYKIPLPNLAIQREIANVYKCYIERQRIAEALKEQLKNICPVLIRGSLME